MLLAGLSHVYGLTFAESRKLQLWELDILADGLRHALRQK